MASDERALATWLAARSDDDLAVIFAARGVSPAAGWRDFFDAADGLLDPISIDRALTKLPRAALHALADPAGAPEAPAVSDTLALRDWQGIARGGIRINSRFLPPRRSRDVDAGLPSDSEAA